MSIWRHDDIHPYSSLRKLDQARCLFCDATLRRIDFQRELSDGQESATVGECSRCGWWVASGSRHLTWEEGGTCEEYQDLAACGALKVLDLINIEAPLQEIRDFLSAKYSDRRYVHPRAFEAVVASVFSDFGYKTRVTAYVGDYGIDVVLDGPNDSIIGVQVKLSRNAIAAEQIRAFVGALVLGGFTRGVFVATSPFRAGAKKAAQLAAMRGLPVELVDADSFYRALTIAQSPVRRIDDVWIAQNIERFFVHNRDGFFNGAWVNPCPT